jgi:Tfp pilus assembly protein PilX
LLSPGDINRAADGPPSRRCGEAGYALTELLVVTSLLAVVLGAILMLAETTQRIAPKENERAMVIREAQVGLHRMTRELRQMYLAPHVSSPSRMEASVLVNGVATRVSYECDQPHPSDPAYTRCMRYQVASDGTKSGGQVVIDRVVNGAGVFTYTPSAADPTYVEAKVDVSARGDLKDGYDHLVALHDGFYMRNRGGG